MSVRNDTRNTSAAAAFKLTRWTLILAAKSPDDPNYEQALAELCKEYQFPIYAYIRRKGNSRHDAQDLAQEFFHRLIAKEFLSAVDRDKGRFRTFLLTALQRFLSNEYAKSQTQKRGGDAVLVTWDADAAEQRYCQEPSHDLTPEKLFERQWAMTLIQATMDNLKSEYERSGKARLFQALHPFIIGETEEVTYAHVAKSLDLTPVNARQWAHRLRRRYGELLRERIAHTVDSQAAVDEEVRNLYALWG